MGQKLLEVNGFAKVEFHRPRDGETPTIFERGIPVVETEAPFHINVGQTVPLSMDRDNVTPAYARDLYAVALDTMVDDLNADEASAPWVATGLPAASAESVVAATSKRFGDAAVALAAQAELVERLIGGGARPSTGRRSRSRASRGPATAAPLPTRSPRRPPPR